MAGIVDQIKERLDIVDLISSYLKLQKSGINYKARCPFHNEKSASFFVSPERQIWHCFGCGIGGDAFGFVKQIEGVEFPEALRILANRAGVELRRPDGRARDDSWEQFQSQKTVLLDISELAAKFFEKQLWQSNTGKQALAYLRERGVTDDSIHQFRLGWSPENWTALYDFLIGRYSDKEIFDAGLIIKKERGGVVDRFRSRIVFPIFDLNSQIVGFTGRILHGLTQTGARTHAEKVSDSQREVAKYVNTPQTAIYDKSRILYGLHAAKLDIRRNNRCLVVEGNMDVIMSHQVGAKHVVASSGTALTDGHLKIIKRYTDNLDLCFDADIAGSIATDRGVDLALSRGFNVGIVTINNSEESASDQHESVALKDPADYVKVHGAKWAEVSQNSRPFMEFYFDAAKKAFDTTTALGKKLFSQKLMPFLASMANKIEQAHWVSEVALALKTKEDILYQAITVEAQKIRPEARNEEGVGYGVQVAVANEGLEPMEETLLSLIIKKPNLVSRIMPEAVEFLSDRLKDLLKQMPMDNNTKPVVELAFSPSPNLNPHTPNPSLLAFNFAAIKSQEWWNDKKENELEDEFQKTLIEIQKRKIKEKLNNLGYDIRTAQTDRDKEKLKVLLSEFNNLSKRLPK